MTNILIMPEEANSYRTLYGDKESTGRTPGQALDALRSQLTEDEAGTLVIVQNHKPDRFFSAAQQERLDELMQLREAGELTAEDEEELERLIEAELSGATERAEALSGAAGQEAFYAPPLEDPYLARVAQESLTHAEHVMKMLMRQSRSYNLAEELTATAIQRVIENAQRYGAAREIENVKAYLVITARNLLIDAQTRKLKAGKTETISWDSIADSSLLNLTDKSFENEIEGHIEAAELKELALKEATPAQRELFDMWFERGMTAADISTHLGISLAAAKLRVQMLIARMRRSIKKSIE